MNFLKFIPLYLFLSMLVIAPGVYSLVVYRLNMAVDFTGGSRLVIKSSKVNELKTSIQNVFPDSQVNITGNTIAITTGPVAQSELDQKLPELKKTDPDLTIETFTSVGPSAGDRLIRQTMTAMAIAITGILIYITRAFKSVKYGLAAIAATLHDSLVILGSFSLLGHFFDIKVDLLFVTALLTTLSFSVHDTIVVFDRIRELKRLRPSLPLYDQANLAINQTLGRSINNSMTIIFMLAALLLFATGSLKIFVLSLLIGAITGTYSSTFTAIPLLVLFDRRKK
jgi:preprotein translocase subunit SecF